MKTNLLKNEQGRSMVEMLGVLAVMGVLSVGGVAMYTNAMNKYRANELLNESSKRAVVIAAQILSGKSVSSDMINQFDNNGTTFTGVEAVGTNQFKLTLSGVDDDVCTQLKATVGSNTVIQEVGDKCAFLTFNNDLSKGSTSSGTGGSTGGSGQQEPVVDLCADVICQNGGKCSGGTCDCTGTGYTGDHCETQLKTFTCSNDGSYRPVSDSQGNIVGDCSSLGGCKITNTFVEANKWSEVCNQQLADGYYICTLGTVYNSNGYVQKCPGMCVGNIKSTIAAVCDNGPEIPTNPLLTCNNDADNTVTDSTNNVVGYCKPLGGCKFNELSSSTNWMQLCNSAQLPPSAYLCYLGKIYNKDGELVKNCPFNTCSIFIDTPPVENMCGYSMENPCAGMPTNTPCTTENGSYGICSPSYECVLPPE